MSHSQSSWVHFREHVSLSVGPHRVSVPTAVVKINKPLLSYSSSLTLLPSPANFSPLVIYYIVLDHHTSPSLHCSNWEVVGLTFQLFLRCCSSGRPVMKITHFIQGEEFIFNFIITLKISDQDTRQVWISVVSNTLDWWVDTWVTPFQQRTYILNTFCCWRRMNEKDSTVKGVSGTEISLNGTGKYLGLNGRMILKLILEK